MIENGDDFIPHHMYLLKVSSRLLCPAAVSGAMVSPAKISEESIHKVSQGYEKNQTTLWGSPHCSSVSDALWCLVTVYKSANNTLYNCIYSFGRIRLNLHKKLFQIGVLMLLATERVLFSARG